MPDAYGNPTQQEAYAMLGIAPPTSIPSYGNDIANALANFNVGSQDHPLEVFYGKGGTTGNKTTHDDLPQWLKNAGEKGDAYAGGMLKPALRYGFKYNKGKIYFADGTSYKAKETKDKKTGKVTYSYTDNNGTAKTYDPTDEQDTYNKKYQNATANQSFGDKLIATADRSRQHVHDILHGAGQALQGKGSIFGGTPLGTKLSNAVTGRHDKPIADQYGGPTAESQAKYVEEHGANSLGYQPQLHAVGSAIGSYYAGNYAGGQLGQAFGGGGGAAGTAGGAAGSAGGAAGSAGSAAAGAAGAGMGYADWINLALQAYGAYNSAQGAKNSQNTLANAMANATTTLGPSTIVGPGGINGTIWNNGEGGTYGLGNLSSANNYLTQLGTQASQNALSQGMPANVTQAANGLQSASSLVGLPDTTSMSNIFSNVLNQNLTDMNRGPTAPGLANQAYSGAMTNIADASRGYNDFYNSTLSNLRAQAQPFEQQQYDALQNDLFGSGRAGTTGGSLQTEAFARGLGQADLSRQLQATQLAQQNQQNSLNVGAGLANIGNQQNQLDESLLQSAFNRFGTTAGLANDLTQQRFGNSVLLNNSGYDRAANNLTNQINLAQLPTALAGQQLNLGTQALNGQSALNQQGLQQFMAALQASQAAANARIGSGTNVSNLAGISAQLPNTSDIWGQVLTGIGSSIGNGQGINWGGLFGGSSPKTTPVVGDQNDPGFVGPVHG